MRIGIDARALTGRYTGDRTYWLNLLRNYAQTSSRDGDEYIIYTRLPLPDEALAPSRNVRVVSIPAANDRVWTLLVFPRALKQDGVDIAHTQYTIPLKAPCPVITTVHDISFRLYPEWFPRKDRLLLNLTVPVAMRRAARVITVSHASRRDILRVYKLDPCRVEAIPNAVSPEFVPVSKGAAREFVAKRFGVHEHFVLSVGVLQPRKNLSMLVEAFARTVHNGGLDYRLVLVGKRGWAYDELMIQVARLRLTDRILVTGYVEDSDLPQLYSAAEMMAFPSLYEGFGLPPLEAMACGAPTLVSDAPAMPEVAGDGALVLPVMDAARWAEAILDLAHTPARREALAAAGRARARCFDWSVTAEQTRRVYRDVATAVAVSLAPS